MKKNISNDKKQEGNPDINKDKQLIKNKKPNEIKKPRLVLDDKTLLYSENGIKKFYEVISSNTKIKNNDISNLNNLIQQFKNWHFMFFPKYDINFFLNKLTDIGKKPSGKVNLSLLIHIYKQAYMSRLRKIYKGEETWDVIYNEQDEILGRPGNITFDPNSPNTNKTYKEDGSRNTTDITNNNKPGLTLNFDKPDELNRKSEINQEKSIPAVSRISDKLLNVSINNINKNLQIIDNDNRDETDVQDLVFNTENLDKDYENFDNNYDEADVADTSKYTREKRNFNKAFSDSLSVGSLHDSQVTKKMKLNN